MCTYLCSEYISEHMQFNYLKAPVFPGAFKV